MHWLNSQIMQSFDGATKFKKLRDAETRSSNEDKESNIEVGEDFGVKVLCRL